MKIRITNAQKEARVDRACLNQLAKKAIRHLKIRTPGTLSIVMIGSFAIRSLNRRFLQHNRITDVLSFRYDQKPHRTSVVGEIFVCPSVAKSYAARHRIAYSEELARYVAHGLLHWLGYEDGTAAQRRRMRILEDQLLQHCE
ncbi:MAG: rRNA maturation RNase YbeY [Candidatus Omnitrophica bacterium]|nr:rRNA maturation RNase YbeY [Candidatus Omnitrophota bacterium]MBI2173634.1 rRNA maturation RNase YbeY [Candidatus Omnitrophota bacterium]MBI3010469.1 rRNA maturation RNase YbeY [Candidatus Omnitrophota bacterium]